MWPVISELFELAAANEARSAVVGGAERMAVGQAGKAVEKTTIKDFAKKQFKNVFSSSNGRQSSNVGSSGNRGGSHSYSPSQSTHSGRSNISGSYTASSGTGYRTRVPNER